MLEKVRDFNFKVWKRDLGVNRSCKDDGGKELILWPSLVFK